MFNKRQAQMLQRFADRIEHAPEAKDGSMLRWAVVPVMDGERTPRIHKLFLLRRNAVEWVRDMERKMPDPDIHYVIEGHTGQG